VSLLRFAPEFSRNRTLDRGAWLERHCSVFSRVVMFYHEAIKPDTKAPLFNELHYTTRIAEYAIIQRLTGRRSGDILTRDPNKRIHYRAGLSRKQTDQGNLREPNRQAL
jgi:hypothetical protein